MKQGTGMNVMKWISIATLIFFVVVMAYGWIRPDLGWLKGFGMVLVVSGLVSSLGFFFAGERKQSSADAKQEPDSTLIPSVTSHNVIKPKLDRGKIAENRVARK